MSRDSSPYDAIIVGLGGMGSASLYELARRGHRVLGLEQFQIPHRMGSSHGYTRVIRLAYFEDPSYVSLLRRAYELWRRLEKTSGEQLLHITGSIDAGPAESRIFRGSKRSCQIHGLPHETLTGEQLSERFPGYRLPPETRAIFQPEGGFLLPEHCILAFLQQARRAGAEIRTGEPVLSWEEEGSGVRVRTKEACYRTRRLLLCAGAWSAKLAPRLDGRTVPERQVVAWFQPLKPSLFRPRTFPVFNAYLEESHYYGIPSFGGLGMKIGRYHHLQEQIDPDEMDRECHPRDEKLLRKFTQRYFPEGAGPTQQLVTCLFTNTADEHFLIDAYPGCRRVHMAAGFSGHGYKFSSVIGEILADLAEKGETRHPIDLFRLHRLFT